MTFFSAQILAISEKNIIRQVFIKTCLIFWKKVKKVLEIEQEVVYNELKW